MGAIVGHEISHSFDDQGSQFDAEGRLTNWWTKADFDHFRAAAQALAAQFETYRPGGPNGRLRCLRVVSPGKAGRVEDGFTADSTFLHQLGQSWRSKVRDAALRQEIVTDGRAPAQYRAETVRNPDAWYAAFSVQPSQRLFLAPGSRVRVW